MWFWKKSKRGARNVICTTNRAVIHTNSTHANVPVPNRTPQRSEIPVPGPRSLPLPLLPPSTPWLPPPSASMKQLLHQSQLSPIKVGKLSPPLLAPHLPRQHQEEPLRASLASPSPGGHLPSSRVCRRISSLPPIYATAQSLLFSVYLVALHLSSFSDNKGKKHAHHSLPPVEHRAFLCDPAIICRWGD